MRTEWIQRPGIALFALFLVCAAQPAAAQLNTQHIKGSVGLKAGTQPPPHWYVLAPLVYRYDTDTVKTAEGNTLPGNADITVSLAGDGVNYVSTRKILSLGWHFNRADVMTAYNIFVPTGRYNHSSTDNLGFGMWEVYARTTTEGGALTIMATFPLAPIRLPSP